MTEGQNANPARSSAGVQPASAEDHGWYLYGIVRHEPASNGEPGPGDLVEAGTSPTQVLEVGDLAAIVRPVLLSEFAVETLTERAGDAVWLEEMVRGHNQVIEAIHRQQTILPAKFGSVYASLADLRAGLEQVEGPLRERLDRLEDADEWAVHVYAVRPPVEKRVAAEDSGIRELQQDLANARPGRAYFLQLKMTDALAAATDIVMADLAQTAYDQLLAHARASQVNAVGSSNGSGAGRMEILRAAFLVARADADSFLDTVADLAKSQDGVDAECTGPWPPYSFAGLTQESSQ